MTRFIATDSKEIHVWSPMSTANNQLPPVTASAISRRVLGEKNSYLVARRHYALHNSRKIRNDKKRTLVRSFEEILKWPLS